MPSDTRKITVDRSRCSSNGICESIAPQFFEVGDDGVLDLLCEQFDEADRLDIEQAIRSCPTMALSITEDN
jgi:ferredoxin